MRTWRSKIVVWHSEKGIKWIEKYTRLCCLECLALGSYVPRFKAHPLLESPRIWNLEKNDSGTRENDHEEIKDVPLSRSLLSLSVPPSHSLSLTHSRRECASLCVWGGEKKRERESFQKVWTSPKSRLKKGLTVEQKFQANKNLSWNLCQSNFAAPFKLARLRLNFCSLWLTGFIQIYCQDLRDS